MLSYEVGKGSVQGHPHGDVKPYRLRIGQENGVLGRREGKEGNRREQNPDGHRSKRKR